MNRGELLDQAKAIVTKDRNDDYGTPEDNFAAIAKRWNLFLKARGIIGPDQAISALDVPFLMIDMKMARAQHKIEKIDNLVDIAGYADCAASIIEPE
ncbi:hypothetical protein JY97_14790 [Alkalispirochaeta odontotermitis]|nr:hypothetical protein JY97_14790 [Alkalispirochaeta odontotermitis]